ncbi:prolipoprotein diacylglyceryl transferase [Nostoc sp.]
MISSIFTPSFIGNFTSPGPILFQLGPFSIRWYGALIACAVIIGLGLSQYLAKRRCINPEFLSELMIWLVIAAIPCARIYYVIFQWSDYSQHPERILAVWRGGLAIHGAILGGIVASLLFARLKQIAFWQLADLVAPSLILGQAIGRWGNFFNSEAFGRPTNLPWKLFIPLDHRPVGYEKYSYFHPTFLYESLWDVIVFGLLMTLFFHDFKARSHLKLGTIFLLNLISYSLGRFWIEGLRTDSLMLGSLRIAQFMSLIVILLGLVGLSWLYILSRSLPDVISKRSLEDS